VPFIMWSGTVNVVFVVMQPLSNAFDTGTIFITRSRAVRRGDRQVRVVRRRHVWVRAADHAGHRQHIAVAQVDHDRGTGSGPLVRHLVEQRLLGLVLDAFVDGEFDIRTLMGLALHVL